MNNDRRVEQLINNIDPDATYHCSMCSNYYRYENMLLTTPEITNKEKCKNCNYYEKPTKRKIKECDECARIRILYHRGYTMICKDCGEFFPNLKVPFL